MDAALAQGMVGMIPFRALLSIARALGGVGADPHRLPGGKAGLADALIARYGAEAILKQWQTEQTPATPPPSAEGGEATGPDTTPKTERSEGGHIPDGPGDAPARGEAEAPAPSPGEAAPGESAEKGEQGEAEATDGAQGDKGEEKGENGPQEGDKAPGDTDPADKAPEAPEAPQSCPEGDPPAPAPQNESMMDKAMRAIAAEEAARAVYPVAHWANSAMLPAFASLADAVRRNAAKGGKQTEMEFLPESAEFQGAPPPVPQQKRQRGAAIQHRLFPKLLALTRAGVYPLMVGPAGTGKSYAARATAEEMARTYADQSLSAGVSESALLGWLLPTGEGGACDYVPSPFVTAYEAGNSVFLFDEIDAASPDMLVILNGALANGGFTVPQRFAAPYVRRGVAVALMGAANTLTGADDSYSARSPIDKATLNRFYPLHWGHDDALEASLMGLPAKQRYWTPQGITEWAPEAWQVASECARKWVAAVRETITRCKLSHVFSMRQAVMYQAALRAGCTHREIRDDLLMGWGPDEIAKLPAPAQPKNAPAAGAEIEAV